MARIRTSRRGKTAAVAAVAREIDFGHFWRQLRAVDWTAKRPRGIQKDWSYSGLLGSSTNDDNESKSEKGTAADVDGQGDEDIRASQIDTTAQLSQHTLDALFEAPSQPNVELSQTAVSRAFDLSPSTLLSDDIEQVAATGDRRAGVTSEQEARQAPAQSAGRVLRPRVQVKQDINIVPEDERMSDYESFSTEESEGEDAIDDDDDCSAASDDEETMSEDDAVQLDEAFIASLLIGNNSLTKKEAEQRAAAQRAKKWTSASSAFEDGVTPYPGLQMEEARPVAELRVLCHSPLLTFFYFMPKSLRVTITEETNEYNKQQLDQRAEAILAKQDSSALKVKSAV
ncbi:hypothetical protein PHYSODRAFT_301145 [Phytophthora sojae]|uniref:Uncharacterized protein n=1 Tax=Phytophthora sojae (strain P6497) TaxID=1094619 RepID=G4ZFP0_PHYSP|nr:hypothetical protein PHYSODRAFT_301145 [Phytophthora sojae]EGZ18508.1 hypothetical protein PHYSODRAFT_301145 [Phytophthora sojae]|eukprot:XP_009527566.1 hypothetical protein PHYSODRAFT_301145 [Phytophthora sojae]